LRPRRKAANPAQTTPVFEVWNLEFYGDSGDILKTIYEWTDRWGRANMRQVLRILAMVALIVPSDVFAVDLWSLQIFGGSPFNFNLPLTIHQSGYSDQPGSHFLWRRTGDQLIII
jgi:hypothetical protein